MGKNLKETVMKKKTTNTMLAVGATLAVCSAAMMGATKTNNKSAQKTIKKATDKVVNFVDTVASFM